MNKLIWHYTTFTNPYHSFTTLSTSLTEFPLSLWITLTIYSQLFYVTYSSINYNQHAVNKKPSNYNYVQVYTFLPISSNKYDFSMNLGI